MEILQDMKFPFKVMLTFLLMQGFSADSPQELSVPVGADVTLSCIFHKPPKQVEWSTLTVEWIVSDERGVKSVVYTLVDGEPHINRAGSVVDEMWLLQSDASLKLCNVTVGDEGVYTCRIIQPVVYTESISVKVLARPSVSLPETAAVMEGQEKTVQCNITGYYPDKLDVTWHIQNGSNTFPAGASQLFSVCTNMAAQNSDGTYSIRSGITLHSSAVKNGGIQLLCRVEHQTFSEPYNRSVILTVQAPSLPPSIVHLLIGLGSSLFLGIIATLVGGSLIIRHFSKDPLSVSQITPNIVYAEVPTQLQCFIQGGKKKHLKVTWFRDGSSTTELGVPSDSCLLLVTEELSHKSSLKSDGENHVSVLPVRLSVEQDMTKYNCVVKWRKKTIRRETTVLVKVEPSLLQISSIPQIPRMEKQLVLCCRVENFYPADVDLVWSRDDSETVSSITHFGPFSSPNHLYSVWSKIELLMAREDERVVYTCRVYHSSFSDQGYKDVTYRINTEGTAPDLKFIECDPQVPLLNKECTLHLCIEGFRPEAVTVIWTKNGEEVTSSVFNTPPSLNISGLYSMFTFLKFTPTVDDKDAEFRCRVVHSAQKEPGEERVFKLPVLQVPNSC